MPQIADNHRRSALPYCLLAMAVSIAACQTARGQGFNLPGQQNTAGSQASDAGRANSASPQPTPSIPRTNLTPINSAPFNPAPRSTPTNPGSITAGQPTGTPQAFNPRPSGLPPVNTGGGYVASPAPVSNPVIATPGNATAANTYPGGSFLGAIFNRNRSTQSPAFAPPTFGQNNFGTAGYPNTAPGIAGQNYGGQGFGAQPYGQSGYGVTVPPPAIGGTIPQSGIPGGFVAQTRPHSVEPNILRINIQETNTTERFTQPRRILTPAQARSMAITEAPDSLPAPTHRRPFREMAATPATSTRPGNQTQCSLAACSKAAAC